MESEAWFEFKLTGNVSLLLAQHEVDGVKQVDEFGQIIYVRKTKVADFARIRSKRIVCVALPSDQTESGGPQSKEQTETVDEH